MPSIYAHYRFGMESFYRLPRNFQAEISPYLDLYQLGLQGPDIFYYFNPACSNHVGKTGLSLHQQPAADFLTPASRMTAKLKNPPAALAYLYGYITHFTLDSQCHGYTSRFASDRKIAPGKVEAEFDRSLLLHDRYSPDTFCRAAHLSSSPRNIRLISLFYPSLEAVEIQRSVQHMKQYTSVSPSLPATVSAILVRASFGSSGRSARIPWVILSRRTDLRCEESNPALMELYQNAFLPIPDLIANFREVCLSGGTLHPSFCHSFEAPGRISAEALTVSG